MSRQQRRKGWFDFHSEQEQVIRMLEERFGIDHNNH
jgi:hypothetical protein